MKLKYFSSILFLCSYLLSCTDSYEIDINNNRNNTKVSKLDELFTHGFHMELKQIYIMSSENTIPILDTPADSCFRGGNVVVNLPNYQTTDYINEYILYGLTRYEKWEVHKMEYEYDTIYWENGFGNSYQLVESIRRIPITIITADNPYTRRNFVTNIKINNNYNYRGHDNHILTIANYSTKDKELTKTNLNLTILVENGNGLFDENHIYFDTNAQVNMTQIISAPLTSNQVKVEISKGNYEIFPKDGIMYYKIGENLYLPRYGDSYIYAGSTSNMGMIGGYTRYYYRFKFRIID